MAEEQTEQKLSLEESFTALEALVTEMEQNDISLEKSFELYRKGMELLKNVNDGIDRVEKEVQKLNADGSFTAMQPLPEEQAGTED